MNKLNIGTKVRIKSKKWYDALKSPDRYISEFIIRFGFNPDMSSYCGKTGTITRAHYNSCNDCYDYSLDLDKGRWHWSEDMFEKETRKMEIE